MIYTYKQILTLHNFRETDRKVKELAIKIKIPLTF
jgi:hypothetical protein